MKSWHRCWLHCVNVAFNIDLAIFWMVIYIYISRLFASSARCSQVLLSWVRVVLVACRRCGSERVNAAAVAVLSVPHGGVPAHRLPPPASCLRPPGESGEPGLLVWVVVCHSGRAHSHEKQPALRNTCRWPFGVRSRFVSRPHRIFWNETRRFRLPCEAPRAVGSHRRKTNAKTRRHKTRYGTTDGQLRGFSRVYVCCSLH